MATLKEFKPVGKNQYFVEIDGINFSKVGVLKMSGIGLKKGTGSYFVQSENDIPSYQGLSNLPYADKLQISIAMGKESDAWIQWLEKTYTPNTIEKHDVTVTFGPESAPVLTWVFRDAKPIGFAVDSTDYRDDTEIQINITLKFNSIDFYDGPREMED